MNPIMRAYQLIFYYKGIENQRNFNAQREVNQPTWRIRNKEAFFGTPRPETCHKNVK